VTELHAGDLVLRPPREEDVPAVAAACQDDDIARFLPLIPRPYREDDARTWLAMTERGWAGEADEKAFAITRDGAFLGVASLRPSVGGIGYWLAPEARGAGVMPRAVAAIIEWGRSEYGVTAFHLLAHPDNLASQRVAEKLGFSRAGAVHHEPAFPDGSTRALRFELAAGRAVAPSPSSPSQK
jgi:RimJ/RimL family protein N-acetyltransferase